LYRLTSYPTYLAWELVLCEGGVVPKPTGVELLAWLRGNSEHRACT
jgi:hypothetical protein